ncbi:MAG: hypothetical protein Q7R85_00950 [bacterium]|nr:hypothetical protein [bacterium]
MTVVTEKRLLREMSILKRDVAALKTVILAQTKDPEGEYRASFVKEVLKAAKGKARHVYDPKTFLKLIS